MRLLHSGPERKLVFDRSTSSRGLAILKTLWYSHIFCIASKEFLRAIIPRFKYIYCLNSRSLKIIKKGLYRFYYSISNIIYCFFNFPLTHLVNADMFKSRVNYSEKSIPPAKVGRKAPDPTRVAELPGAKQEENILSSVRLNSRSYRLRKKQSFPFQIKLINKLLSLYKSTLRVSILVLEFMLRRENNGDG